MAVAASGAAAAARDFRLLLPWAVVSFALGCSAGAAGDSVGRVTDGRNSEESCLLTEARGGGSSKGENAIRQEGVKGTAFVQMKFRSTMPSLKAPLLEDTFGDAVAASAYQLPAFGHNALPVLRPFVDSSPAAHAAAVHPRPAASGVAVTATATATRISPKIAPQLFQSWPHVRPLPSVPYVGEKLLMQQQPVPAQPLPLMQQSETPPVSAVTPATFSHSFEDFLGADELLPAGLLQVAAPNASLPQAAKAGDAPAPAPSAVDSAKNVAKQGVDAISGGIAHATSKAAMFVELFKDPDFTQRFIECCMLAIFVEIIIAAIVFLATSGSSKR